jgi:hypothetical protein
MWWDDTILSILCKGQSRQRVNVGVRGRRGLPYNVFNFTLNRGRDGPKHFLNDYREVLLADAYGGYNGLVAGNQIMRARCLGSLSRLTLYPEWFSGETAFRCLAGTQPNRRLDNVKALGGRRATSVMAATSEYQWVRGLPASRMRREPGASFVTS